MCKIAMISMHTCPLACPEGLLGGHETGGMNVYVRELSRELGRRGKSVDVFTRFQDTETDQVQPLGYDARVVHLPAGLKGPYDKNKLVNHIDEFAAGIDSFAEQEGIRYDLIHSHYWLSGLAAHRLQERWSVPMVQMFHTLGHLKNRVAKDPADREADVRIQAETDIMRWADGLIAATPLEKAQMAWCYGADTDKVTVVPAGVDTELFHPRDRRTVRRRLGVPGLDTPILLFVGRLERL